MTDEELNVPIRVRGEVLELLFEAGFLDRTDSNSGRDRKQVADAIERYIEACANNDPGVLRSEDENSRCLAGPLNPIASCMYVHRLRLTRSE